MSLQINQELKNKINQFLIPEDDLTDKEMSLLIDVIDSFIDYEDLSIPEVYKSDFGFGFIDCESDCYETAFDAKIAAIRYAIINY